MSVANGRNKRSIVGLDSSPGVVASARKRDFNRTIGVVDAG